jgi:hypothetical protein
MKILYAKGKRHVVYEDEDFNTFLHENNFVQSITCHYIFISSEMSLLLQ